MAVFRRLKSYFQRPSSHGSAVDFNHASDDTGETRIFSSLIGNYKMKVKTFSDESECCITGIAVLSSGKVVLADITNKSLKLVDKQKALVDKKVLNSGPWDIAALPGEQIAVTLPDEQQILILTTAGTLSILDSIAVNGRCRSVAYHQYCLYVLCWYPNNVQVLDIFLGGIIWKTISLEDPAVIATPYYIRLSQNHKFLHVSDRGNNSIVNVTLQGEVSYLYEYSDLYQPSGMLVLEDGSVLVCCSWNGTIHHVSADLTEGHEVMDGLSFPRSICYSPERNQVYVGGKDDYLQVFDMQYKQPIVTVKGSQKTRPLNNGAKVCTGNGSLNMDIDTKAVPPKANAATQSRAHKAASHAAKFATPSTANTSAQPTPNVSTVVKANTVDTSRKNARQTEKTRIFSSIVHKADFNVKTRSNQGISYIAGIAVLSSGNVVLADRSNGLLKLVDIQKNALIEEKRLDSGPWDIAALPEDHIAVTLPDKPHILIITTAGTLSILHSIAVKRQCRSVTYYKKRLYVLCRYPNTVYVLDMKGNIMDTISLENSAVIANPYCIRLSQNHQFLHVSDWDNNSIVNVTLQGEVSACVYKHNDLYRPLGMLVLEDGSLLVCCNWNNTIHHVSTDLTEGHEVMDLLRFPGSICYSLERNHVYVGGEDDYLQSFYMQYKQPIVTVDGSQQTRPFKNGAKGCVGGWSIDSEITEEKEVEQAKFARREKSTEATFTSKQNPDYVRLLNGIKELSTTTAVPPKANATQSRANNAASHTAKFDNPSTANTSAKPRPSVPTLARANIVDVSRANAGGTGKTRTFSSMIHKADINVKTRSDQISCHITGIAELSSGKVVLADINNQSIKRVDIPNKTVAEEKEIGSGPLAITALPGDQIAVILLNQLLIMTIAGKPSIIRSIKVNGTCRSVAYHEDCLYVLCWYPDTVYILDMKGNVKKTISLGDSAVSFPYFIVFSQDHTFLYVINTDSIVSLTLHGKVSVVYKLEERLHPQGMAVLEDGSLLVCCNQKNGTIHHVSADLKQGQKVMDGFIFPRSICYSADKNQIYVGGEGHHLKVFDILYR